jgi:hypothetical protein
MTETRAIKISGLVSELVKAAREFLLKRYPGPAGNHHTNEPADVRFAVALARPCFFRLQPREGKGEQARKCGVV